MFRAMSRHCRFVVARTASSSASTTSFWRLKPPPPPPASPALLGRHYYPASTLAACWRARSRTRRCLSVLASEAEASKARNRSTGLYVLAVAVFTVGLAYASVPLYRLFCQVTGYGGTVQERVEDKLRMLGTEQELPERYIKVDFNADVSGTMPWRFMPAQKSISVQVGETALAFYKAKNCTDRAITGVAAYNVSPMKAGVYFHKVQCFCFEEQRLLPNESIDMPVFFFLDPELHKDPNMDDVHSLTLSYTFFPVDEDDDDDDDDDDE